MFKRGFIRFAFWPVKTDAGWIWLKFYTQVGKRARKIPR